MIIYIYHKIRDLTTNNRKHMDTEPKYAAAFFSAIKEIIRYRLIQYLKLPNYCCVCVSNH